MLAYIVRRTILALFTVWVISALSYWIASLPPGDMVDRFLGHRSDGPTLGRTVREIEVLREVWGVNRPAVVQYWDWLSGIVLRGDFGYSFSFPGGVLGEGLGASPSP